MKSFINKINDIHEFTYMLFTISVETAILAITLAIYYVTADGLENTAYYTSVASDLLISVRDMLISAVIFSVISEYIIRAYEK